MEGEEFKFWIDKLNKMFQENGINSVPNFWNNVEEWRTTDEVHSYLADFATFLEDLFHNNNYFFEHMSPKVSLPFPLSVQIMTLH